MVFSKPRHESATGARVTPNLNPSLIVMFFNICSLVFIHRKRFSFSSLCNYFLFNKNRDIGFLFFFFFAVCYVLIHVATQTIPHVATGAYSGWPGYFRYIPITVKFLTFCDKKAFVAYSFPALALESAFFSGTRVFLSPWISIFLRNPCFLVHFCAMVIHPQPVASFISFRISPPIFIFQNLDNTY